MTRTYEWMKAAPCRDRNELFFDETAKTVVKKAVEICGNCAVREQCLSHAIQNREIGIWGGLTTNQRAKMARRKRSDKVNIATVSCSKVSGHGEETQ